MNIIEKLHHSYLDIFLKYHFMLANTTLHFTQLQVGFFEKKRN